MLGFVETGGYTGTSACLDIYRAGRSSKTRCSGPPGRIPSVLLTMYRLGEMSERGWRRWLAVAMAVRADLLCIPNRSSDQQAFPPHFRFSLLTLRVSSPSYHTW